MLTSQTKHHCHHKIDKKLLYIPVLKSSAPSVITINNHNATANRRAENEVQNKTKTAAQLFAAAIATATAILCTNSLSPTAIIGGSIVDEYGYCSSNISYCKINNWLEVQQKQPCLHIQHLYLCPSMCYDSNQLFFLNKIYITQLKMKHHWILCYVNARFAMVDTVLKG